MQGESVGNVGLRSSAACAGQKDHARFWHNAAMECPRCGASMEEQTFEAHLGRKIAIDICFSCQAFWFDTRESIGLTPGATLALFRLMGDRVGQAPVTHADTAKCPRCRTRLRHTSDMQRTTRFEYWRCPHDHGRLTTFFDFLREKDFIKPLSPRQLAELRRSVQTVNCSNCGAPVDLTIGAACAHCGSPLSMLDLQQAERLIAQLRQAEARAAAPIDPGLPLDLARARREVERAFPDERQVANWLQDAATTDLLGASLVAVAKWLKRAP